MTCADVAAEHERGGAIGPTLENVWAARFLADGVQIQTFDQLQHLVLISRIAETDAQPFWLGWTDLLIVADYSEFAGQLFTSAGILLYKLQSSESIQSEERIMVKSLLFLVVLLTTISIAHADVPKPKTPAKPVLHTSLEIVPDATVYEAKLQISQSDFKNLRAALDGDSGSAPIVGGIAFSAPRTIIAGLLMFMAVSFTGVMIARSSSFGRRQKTVAAALLVAVVLGAAAIITRGNAGPPPSWRWHNLPQNLAEGKPTIGGVDVEIVPDGQMNGRTMKLIIPLKKAVVPGEE
jgi:hypothetical protein